MFLSSCTKGHQFFFIDFKSAWKGFLKESFTDNTEKSQLMLLVEASQIVNLFCNGDSFRSGFAGLYIDHILK